MGDSGWFIPSACVVPIIRSCQGPFEDTPAHIHIYCTPQQQPRCSAAAVPRPPLHDHPPSDVAASCAPANQPPADTAAGQGEARVRSPCSHQQSGRLHMLMRHTEVVHTGPGLDAAAWAGELPARSPISRSPRPAAPASSRVHEQMCDCMCTCMAV